MRKKFSVTIAAACALAACGQSTAPSPPPSGPQYENVQPIATVTGLYRGKFGGLELLTPDKPLTRDEVRRNPIFYELDLHPEQDDENLIIDVIYDNMSPLCLQDLYRGTDIPRGVRFWPDWFDIPPYAEMRDVDGRCAFGSIEKRSEG